MPALFKILSNVNYRIDVSIKVTGIWVPQDRTYRIFINVKHKFTKYGYVVVSIYF